MTSPVFNFSPKSSHCFLWGFGIHSMVRSIVSAGLWGTALTENISSNRELFVRTTLRELVIYIFFLVDTCLCEYSARIIKLLLRPHLIKMCIYFTHYCRKCNFINLKR